MKTYQFDYKATFQGVVDVRAESKVEAKEILERDFGGLNIEIVGGSNVSEDVDEEGVSNWDFDMSPVKTVIS